MKSKNIIFDMDNFFPRTLNEVSEILKANTKGNKDFQIKQLNRIDLAQENELTFYSDKKYQKQFKNAINSKSAIIISQETYDSLEKNEQDIGQFIIHNNPYRATLELCFHIDNYYKQRFNHLKLKTELNIKLGLNPTIANNVIVEFNTIIGDNVTVYPNCYIGNDVEIGDNTIIYPNVTIMSGTKIGANCIIHSGAVIGSDGFGYYEENNKYIKIPQIGNVIIEDYVEIGANTTIDRSFIGSTIIKHGVKIDNLVQIGHNCIVGENTAMASQVGVAGTVTIGKNVRLGGQVGVAGHLDIGDNITIIAQSGVSKSILESGTYFGSPIKEAVKAFKIEAVVRNLPQMSIDLSNIKKDIAELKKMNEK